MKICLVATFPPSGRQLNEYAFHIARELQRNPHVELTILADELDDYGFATDANGESLKATQQPELPGFNVIRCWKFGSMSTPVRLLKTIRSLKPDVVWFNLVFSSFATPENPIAAFAGLSTPALSRACNFYTHVTLHHVIEVVDFAAAGVRWEKLFRVGTDITTRVLLKANSVSVLLPGYRKILVNKYSVENVLLGRHGTFASAPDPPDFSKRGNPEYRILAIGHWGTYKRLETLMEAFPMVLKEIPNARSWLGPTTTPRPATGKRSVRHSRHICPLSSADTLRRRISLNFSGRPRSWCSLMTPPRDRAVLPIRRANTAFPSLALTSGISGIWARTRTWRYASTRWETRPTWPIS
jgi:glycosyltransferase involved in cell wall biosynthesis